MALRKIALEGEACLSKVCRPVTDFNSRLHTLLDDLADTLPTPAAWVWLRPRWAYCAGCAWCWTRRIS